MTIIDRRGVIVSATDPAIGSDPNPDLAFKAPVRAATTANITLSGLQTIDGVVLAAADRVLVKNQTTGTQNGIYNASTGNWTRSIDFASNSQVARGLRVFVNAGTANSQTEWFITTSDPIVIGTTSIAWAQMGISASSLGSLLSQTSSALAGTVVTATSQLAFPNSRLLSSTAPITVTDSGGGAAITIGLTTPLAQSFGGTGATSFSNLNNTRLAKTTAYPVANADKGKTIAFGGSAYYTVTVNAASGYDSDFQVRLLNEDSGRGKLLAINGLTSFILWPLQSIVLYNQNNVWQVDPKSQRYAPASGAIIFVNPTFGSDSNDGLATSAGALATMTAAYQLQRDQIDHRNGSPQIKCDASQTFNVGAGLFVNYQLVGGRPLQITGDAGVVFQCNAGGVVFQARDGGATIILSPTGSSFGVISTNGNASAGITASQSGVCDTPSSGLTFYAFPLGTHVQLTNGGTTDFQGGYTIADPFSSGTATHINLEGAGCHCNYQIPTGATFSNTPAITNFLIASDCAVFYTAGINPTFTSAPAAGCKKYTIQTNAVATTAGTTLPGTVAGTSALGGQFS